MSPTDVLAVVVPFSLIALGWLALHDTRASRISSRSWRHLGWISCLAAVSVGGFIRFLAAGGALSTWDQTGMLVQAIFNGAVALVVVYRWLKADREPSPAA